MRFLLRTLSVSYFKAHPGQTLLAVAGIAIGVATFVAINAAERALVEGLGTTIDRLAGRAQIQVTGLGGVPEGLETSIREISVIAAEGPVIEQMVQPQPASLGGLLILAVDLVGDREIRDYDFDGQDADVDDPIEFLAQPDSIALSREFADRAGLRKGDTLTVQAGSRERRFTIRALLDVKGFARAYGGNVAVTDVYAAQDMFGRGRHFDRIDVRLQPGASVEAGVAAIKQVVGPGYRVETPERRGLQAEQVAHAFVRAFNVASLLALGIGLFLIFNICTISVQRRRRDIGILRAAGATPLQVTTLFLCEAAVLGLAGGALGALVGQMVADQCFNLMGASLQVVQGMTDASHPVTTASLLLLGLSTGLVAALVGAFVPAREAARIPPTEALAAGVFTTTAPRPSGKRVLVGAGLLIMGFAVSRFSLVTGPALLPIVSVCGGIGVSLVAGWAARTLIGPIAPILARLAPAAGRLAIDSLVGHPRRTAGTAAVLTVNMAFVLGVAGYLESVHATFDQWVGDVITADLMVRASPGLGPSRVRLPGDLGPRLLQVPGVQHAEGFRNDRVVFRGEEVALVAFDAREFATHTRHTFSAGDERAFSTAIPSGQAVVSDNFARRFKVGLADTLELDSLAGPIRLPIAAVVVDFISERGTIMIDRSTFATHWRDDRVDAFHLRLEPGADPNRVRGALRTALQADVPALVSTRAEFVEEVDAALDLFYTLIHATVAIALLVAFMGVCTSLLVSVAERSRDIGVLKALGAMPGQLGGAVVLEAVTLALVTLVLALPLGELLAWFLRTRVAGDFRFPHAYPVSTLLESLVLMPLVSLVATWMPTRWALSLPVADALAYE